MATTTKLNGNAGRVKIGRDGSTLEAPGLIGQATELDVRPTGNRSAGDASDKRIDKALEAAEVRYHKAFEIEVTLNKPVGGSAGGRAAGPTAQTRLGEPAVVLTVPDVRSDEAAAVLYTDEAGRSRWIWPEARTETAATRGGGGNLVFHLPRQSAEPPPTTAAAQTRGPLTKLARRVVRVLYWVTDEIVGRGARAVAERWENSRRAYAFRPLTDLAGGTVPWAALAGGRALLLLHGTFSSAAAAFGEWPAASRDALAGHYGGRVFAFDHPSLHHSPAENADHFFKLLPAGAGLEVDVVTHSRGGLVARELIERQHDAPRKIRVRRAVFVAAPHGGTMLADGKHGTALLDAYTDLLTDLPDGAFAFTIEGVLTAVKIAAHGALAGLPGLNSMLPTGDYLKGLNVAAKYDTKYYAIAADFKPAGQNLAGRFAAFVADGVMAGIFGEANDGVVPTRGCHAGDWQAASFPVPVERQFLFGPGDDVHHCNYFRQQKLADSITRWLTA